MELKLNFTVIEFSVAPKVICQSGILSGKGAVFEKTLQQLACAKNKTNCAGTVCEKWTTCPVAELTARKLSNDLQLRKLHQKPGLPYVFSSVAPFCITTKPECFYLLLIEDTIKHLDLLIRAVTCCCGHGSHKVGLSAMNYQMQPLPLLTDANGVATNLPVLDAIELVAQSGIASTTAAVRIDFLSPLRLIKNSKELTHFHAPQFVRAVLRRLSSLSAYYGKKIDADQIKYLAQMADDVHIDQYQPVATEGQTFTRGVTGSYLLKNLHQELIPYLLTGSLLNLGKGASYGMGIFRVNHG